MGIPMRTSTATRRPRQLRPKQTARRRILTAWRVPRVEGASFWRPRGGFCCAHQPRNMEPPRRQPLYLEPRARALRHECCPDRLIGTAIGSGAAARGICSNELSVCLLRRRCTSTTPLGARCAPAEPAVPPAARQMGAQKALAARQDELVVHDDAVPKDFLFRASERCGRRLVWALHARRLRSAGWGDAWQREELLRPPQGEAEGHAGEAGARGAAGEARLCV